MIRALRKSAWIFESLGNIVFETSVVAPTLNAVVIERAAVVSSYGHRAWDFETCRHTALAIIVVAPALHSFIVERAGVISACDDGARILDP